MNDIKKIIDQVADQYVQDEYAMYLRKSRADVELEAISKEETLARHKEMLYALAERHNISPSQITVYHEVVSGDSIDSRPEMQRLIDDVYTKKYKGVLVVEVERLARGNTKDQGEVAEAFQFTGTEIITPSKVYNPNNEFDQEYFEFGLFMSRREYKTIRRRLESGKYQSAKEGNYILSRPLFGYNIERISKKDRLLVENPTQARLVKMMFDWYTEERRPTSWIARKFTEMGVKTQTGNTQWERATIKEMLFNYHYIGKIVWNKRKTISTKDPMTGKIVKKVVPGNMELFEGKHKPLISEEQFYKVREIYGQNAPVKQNTELVNPLSGLVKCRKCGRAIRYMNATSRATTSPRYIHPTRIECKMKSVIFDDLLNALVDALNNYIDDFKVKMESTNENTSRDNHLAMIEAVKGELAKYEKMKRKLFDSWDAEDGMYTKEEFLERKQMYARTIEDLKIRIEDMEATMPEEVNYQERITTIHSVIDCIKDDTISAKEKNIFLKSIIDTIEYNSIDLGVNKGAKLELDVYLK